MKKYLTIYILAIMLLLSGCGKSAEAKKVDDMIQGIGTVDLNSEAAIKAAEDAYGLLSDKDKEGIECTAKLFK